jgi:cytoskeleton-associated protein 5
LAEILAVLLEDGYEGARNEAASCFGYLMKMVGERPLNAIMDNIADIRKAKIKEAFEKATVKCKAGTGAPPPRAASAPAAKKPASKPRKQEKTPSPEDGPAQSKTSAPPKTAAKPAVSWSILSMFSYLMYRLQPKKPPVSAPPAKKTAATTTVPKASSKAGAPSAPGNLDSVKYKHPPEEAESLAAELIPGNILTDLGDANWKTRLAALDELSAWLEGQMETLDAEVLVRSLAKRGWSEKNFQVRRSFIRKVAGGPDGRYERFPPKFTES